MPNALQDPESGTEPKLWCFSCQTYSLDISTVAPTPDLAQRGVEHVAATKCSNCGDVRVYASGTDDSLPFDLRAEFDEMAALLTEVARDSA